MEERVNPIILTMADGTEYTLDFNRSSVAWAEQRGFVMEELDSKMMTRVPELFFYAFRMHHPTMTRIQTDKILFDDMKGLSNEIITRLGALYLQALTTLINDDPKNSTVTVVM